MGGLSAMRALWSGPRGAGDGELRPLSERSSRLRLLEIAWQHDKPFLLDMADTIAARRIAFEIETYGKRGCSLHTPIRSTRG